MDMSGMMQSPGAAEGGPEQIDPSKGFCIEISVLPDGTFNVAAEPLDQEEQGESAGQPAGDIKEALTAALDLYKQVTENAPSADDEFSAGFGPGPEKGAPPVERGMKE